MKLKDSFTDQFYNRENASDHKFVNTQRKFTRIAIVSFWQDSPYHKPRYTLAVVWQYLQHRKVRTYDLTRKEYIKLLRYCVENRAHASKLGYSTRGDFTRGNVRPIRWSQRKYLDGAMGISGQKDFDLSK